MQSFRYLRNMTSKRIKKSSRRRRRAFVTLGADRFNSPPQLGFEELETRALLAVVSGTFFTDLGDDGAVGPDGIQTAGDTGRIGETVRLFSSDDTLIGTSTTDASGFYEFTGVAAGDYYVEFTEPDGAFFTAKDLGGDDTADSDADPTTGRTDVFTVAAPDAVDFDAGAVNEFSPAGFDYLLRQFGASLQNILVQSEDFEGDVSEVSLVGENGIPFIEDALSSVVDFTSTFNELGNLLFEPVELTLPSAPAAFTLAEEARLLVSVSGDTPLEVVVPTTAHADLGELLDTVNMALADAGLDGQVQAEELDGSGIITFSTIQDDLDTTLRIGTIRITTDMATPLFGQPLANVSFDLTTNDGSGDTVTNISLPTAVTQDNIDASELADDLNDAFGNADLSEVVAFATANDELVIAATGPEIVSMSIADVSNLDALGFSAVSEDANLGALELGFDDGGGNLVGGRAAAGFKFNSINSLIDALNDALMEVVGVPLTANYDNATESLLLGLDFGVEYSKDISLGFSEGLDLGALGTLEVAGGADATFTAMAGLDVVVGFDLTALGSSFTLTTATTLTELNNGDGVALNVGLKAADVAPADGQLTGDAAINVIIDGQAPVPVTVTASATSSNADELALVDDLQGALVAAGLDGLVSAGSAEATIPNDGVEGRKITLTAIDPTIRSLRIENADELGFDMAGQDGDRADLRISLRDGTSFEVNLDGSETIADIIDAIETQSSALVDVNINADQSGLNLVDLSVPAGNNVFTVSQPTVTEGFPAVAGFALGILKSAVDSSPDTIQGDTLAGETLLDRFFLDASQSGLSIDATISASNIDLTAALSFLEIGFEGGTLDFQVGTGVDFTDPDASGRITLSEMFDSSIVDLFDLVPLTATGTAELPLSDSVFELVAPDYDTSTQDPAIEASISASLDGIDLSLGPNADLQTVFEDVISQFKDFGIDDLVLLLSNLADVILDSDLPLLNEEIPLIDQSIGDVIGFADRILDAITELGTLMDVDDLTAAADDLETGISNLSLMPAEKTEFDKTLAAMREAIFGR